MQRFGHQVLAGSSGPGDESRAIVRRHAADAREQIPHQRAAANQPLEARGLHQLAVERQRALPRASIVQQLLHAAAQSGDRDGLVQIIAGALLDGLDGGFRGVVRGHQDHVDGGSNSTMRSASDEMKTLSPSGCNASLEGSRFAGASSIATSFIKGSITWLEYFYLSRRAGNG